MSPQQRSGIDHTVFTLLTHHTYLHLVRVHQAAPPLASSSSHLITVYYSFIDSVRMKGWVGLVSWPIQLTVYPLGYPSAADHVQTRESSHQTPTFYVYHVLPLSYTTIRNVCLALHWRCVTDLVVYPPTTQWPMTRRWTPRLYGIRSSLDYGTFAFTYGRGHNNISNYIGSALDKAHNSRRPLDRYCAFYDPVTLTFDLTTRY